MSLKDWIAWFLLAACIAELALGKSKSTDEWDIMVIGTLDGKLHGLDANDGSLRWTMETGGCLVSS